MNVVLWILQVLLALLFLFAGGTKLIMPLDVLLQQGSPNQIMFPGWFIRFIGVCEVLGALGLILPGVFKTRQYLTPLAALGLAVIMVGAIVVTIMGDGVRMAIGPFVFLLLLLFVAYGRRAQPHRLR
ncbi:MAG TPA: DoxX family protein [Pyrinomonadaceae bacterium]|nr:DoxX family protein [Pyrinomonadaceae bacterium]